MKDSDPHKDTVYTWEDSWPGWNKNHITFAACRAMVYAARYGFLSKRQATSMTYSKTDGEVARATFIPKR